MEETLRFVHSYIVCITVKDVDRVDGDTDFIPVDENLTDTSPVSMFSQIHTNSIKPRIRNTKGSNQSKPLSRKPMLVEHHNRLLYGYTYGRKSAEKGDRLTRKSMLNLICKSEEEFKTSGASITEMVKVFEHYKIQVRILQCF